MWGHQVQENENGDEPLHQMYKAKKWSRLSSLQAIFAGCGWTRPLFVPASRGRTKNSLPRAHVWRYEGFGCPSQENFQLKYRIFIFFFVVLLGEEHINSAICLTDSPIFNVLRYYNAKLNKDYTSNNNFVIRFQISPFWVIKFLPIQFHHKLKVLNEKFWLSQINSNFIMKCPSVYRI